ncbi:MAG TPA: FliH/SctL family protein [Edaphobacter sp.]|uniref:FliH/SctL family protein n=1 Tax=Edaphobacter sp. TaxID=1934404 RepID=UPI002C6AEF15|nr:FliH/SctL family protein [Edaphobacter sp.]HUZ96271.1 FliH/SctL family protein [Edaphobacter sp.]
MISLSEEKGNANTDHTLPGMPGRLMGGLHKKNDISRLEFYSLSEPGTDPAQDTDVVQVLNADEVYTQEQVEEIKAQLELQQQGFSAQMESVRSETRAESRQEWEEELLERVLLERARVTQALEAFEVERKRYFIDVEAEVVKLALAIAARILHREAKLDPLLLTAAVRVVLDKVTDNSTMELRVPAGELESWKNALEMDAESRVQLVGDVRLEAGECILEAAVGKVELGIRAQLEEIEKGFFDLLQQRPA